jgi:polyhydroxybutyrate depolymerase
VVALASFIFLAGCRRSTLRAVGGTDTMRTVVVDGRQRQFVVHIPGVHPRTDMPLVLNFHGWGSTAHEQIRLTGMNSVADREGFAVAYPEGIGPVAGFNAGDCCGEAITERVDDVALTRAILDDLERAFPIDSKRVYATGMSNGGFMSHRLACELSDRIAAIAPVAGVIGVHSCSPTRSVSVLQFHGTADTLVRYQGGGLATFVPVETTVRDWARRDGCPGIASDWSADRRMVTYRRGDVTCETYAGCAKGTEVTLCRIDGGGHTWPGGAPIRNLGKTTNDVSATEAMWRFFAAHPM